MSPKASRVEVGCADYLQRARIPGQDKARGATALLPLQGSALTLLVTYGAPLNTESAFWGTSLHTPHPTPAFWASYLSHRPATPLTLAPSVRGTRRALGLQGRRFRCLFAANCLCRKMLVTRAESFRPALANPAGGSLLIPPAKPQRNRLQGGGCAILGRATGAAPNSR